MHVGRKTMGPGSEERRVQDCDPHCKTCWWVLPMAIRIHKLLCQKLTMEEWHWRCGAWDFWCCERSGPWAWFVYGAMGPPWPLIWWHHSLQWTLSWPTSWASDNVKLYSISASSFCSLNCHRSEVFKMRHFVIDQDRALVSNRDLLGSLLIMLCYIILLFWPSIIPYSNVCIAMTEGLYWLVITMWTVLCSLHVYTYGTIMTSFVFVAGMVQYQRSGWMETKVLQQQTWITYLIHGLQLFTNCSPMQTFSLTRGQMFDGLVTKQGRQGLRIGPWWIDLLSLLEVERQSKLILYPCVTIMSFYHSYLDWYYFFQTWYQVLQGPSVWRSSLLDFWAKQ